MVVLTGVVSLYYNVILAWTLYYFGMSFSPVLPWSNCDNAWNTVDCYTRTGTKDNITIVNLASNVTDVTNLTDVTSLTNVSNLTEAVMAYNSTNNRTRSTASEEFWQ